MRSTKVEQPKRNSWRYDYLSGLHGFETRPGMGMTGSA